MKLIHHKSCKVKNYSVSVQNKVEGQHLLVEFLVHTQNSKFIQPPTGLFHKQSPQRNWQLWNYDVVEVFLQKKNNAAKYLEFQSTISGEEFALEIYQPRIQYATPLYAKNTFSHETNISSWKSIFKFELDAPIDHYKVGLFACLGQGDREYLSLNPNHEETPDFHRPELFTSLAELL